MRVGARCIRCRLAFKDLVMVNLLVVMAVVKWAPFFFGRCVEQRDVYSGRNKNPRRNIPLSLAMGTGFVLVTYILASAAYILVLPLHGDPHGATVFAQACSMPRGSRRGRGPRADFSACRRLFDGRCDIDFDIRLRERDDAGWSARLLRDGAGQAVLSIRRQAASENSRRRSPGSWCRRSGRCCCA